MLQLSKRNPCGDMERKLLARAGFGTLDYRSALPVALLVLDLPTPIVEASVVLYSELRMQAHTETLEVGSTAPDFSLAAANREDTFSLSRLLAKGPVILEFLRGTW